METVEDLWRTSTARYYARRRDQHRWEWVRHFDRMAKSHARISEDYARRAEELIEEPTCVCASGYSHGPQHRTPPDRREQDVASM